MGFHLVVAYDRNLGIGFKGRLPWQLKKDMQWFKTLTTQTNNNNTDNPNNSKINSVKINSVIMGRKTWESIPERFRPLVNRHNFIVSRHFEPISSSDSSDSPVAIVRWTNDFSQALDQASEISEKIYVIGGGMLYQTALTHPDLESIYATEIDFVFEVDKHFPDFKKKFPQRRLIRHEKETYDFSIYQYTP